MKVLYFAWLRTKVGSSSEDLVPPVEVATIGDLMTWLATERPGFAEAMSVEGVIRCAVNQQYADRDHPVQPGDEVAFFPPVTGG
jgi:molybdopterin synthase sulfur carrier subunit